MQGSRDSKPGEPDHDVSAPSSPSLAGGEAANRLARLTKRAEFLRAAQGRRVHSRFLSLQVVRRTEPESEGGEPRFGLTVTKKVGNAVVRNRIRRRLRQALRSDALAPKPGHDYVIVARRDVLTVPFTQLIEDLSRTFRQSRNPVRTSRGGRDTTGRGQHSAGATPT